MTDINNIQCQSIFDKETDQCIANKWTMQLTPACHESFKQNVFPHFEIEVLKGSKSEQPDGRIKYEFELDNIMSHALKTSLFNVISEANQRFN